MTGRARGVLSFGLNSYCTFAWVLYRGQLPDVVDLQVVKPERASERRIRELKALAAQGVLVRFETPWTARVGTLQIWMYSGRWLNETTGQSGRMNQLTMRELIERF